MFYPSRGKSKKLRSTLDPIFGAHNGPLWTAPALPTLRGSLRVRRHDSGPHSGLSSAPRCPSRTRQNCSFSTRCYTYVMAPVNIRFTGEGPLTCTCPAGGVRKATRACRSRLLRRQAHFRSMHGQDRAEMRSTRLGVAAAEQAARRGGAAMAGASTHTCRCRSKHTTLPGSRAAAPHAAPSIARRQPRTAAGRCAPTGDQRRFSAGGPDASNRASSHLETVSTSICCTGPRTGAGGSARAWVGSCPRHRHRRSAASGTVVRAVAGGAARAQPHG